MSLPFKAHFTHFRSRSEENYNFQLLTIKWVFPLQILNIHRELHAHKKKRKKTEFYLSTKERIKNGAKPEAVEWVQRPLSIDFCLFCSLGRLSFCMQPQPF